MPEPVSTMGGADGVSDSSISNIAALTVAVNTPKGRYDILEEIARGGMGVIYRAFDTILQREVAVKALQDGFDPSSGAGRRFIAEGRITGQLQHPGIPAVHDLGTLPDGKPFLAMKLIKGQTLDALLKDRTSGSPNLVAVFEQICHAVGYAHAHGVIHRDLKPSNVMVGAFGEVQVMDWGLAKILGSNEREQSRDDPETTTAAVTQIASQRDDSDATRAGSVLGTPSYMSPEQAIGAVDQVDARSDVFGLGAVLCCILTGSPPYASGDSESTRQLAARGRLDEARSRLRACGAEPGLVTLCERCLSPEKADRPAEAGAVASEVASLRAAADERARQSELERVRAEGQRARAEAESREQLKRRRVQLALAAAVCLLAIVGGAFAWYSERQSDRRRAETENRNREEQARLTRNGETLAELIRRSEDALRSGDAESSAVAIGEIERMLPDGGGDTLLERIDKCRADLALLRQLDAIDVFRWTPDENKLLDEKAPVVLWQKALADFGLKPGQTVADDAARRISASLVRDRLLTALDLWLLYEPSTPLRELLRAADADPYRDAMRDAVAMKDKARQTYLVGSQEALAQPAWFAAALGRNNATPVKRRREVLEAALRSRRGDLALHMELGYSYPFNQRQGADERARWFQAAVATHPRSVVARSCLGLALLDNGDLDGAVACQQQAVALAPDFAGAHNNLGYSLQAKGDLDAAVRCYNEALRLQPKFPQPYANLAKTMIAKGDMDAAVRYLNEVIRINPRSAPAQNYVGWIECSMKNLDTAIGCFKEAIQIDAKYAPARLGLGSALQDKGNLSGAIDSFKEAVKLEPEDAISQTYLGWALYSKKDLDGAERCFKEAIRLNPRFAAAHNNLGIVQTARGNLDGAISFFMVATCVDPKFANAYINLAFALEEKKNMGAAITSLREATRLEPKSAELFITLGTLLRKNGDLDEAIDCFKDAIRVDPMDPLAHNNLGVALWNKGELDKAVGCLKAAIRLDPKNAMARRNLGLLLRDKGDLDGAVHWYNEAIRLEPGNAKAREIGRSIEAMKQLLPRLDEVLAGRAEPKTPAEACKMAEMCMQRFQNRLAASARLYEKAFAADPNIADDLLSEHRFNAASSAAQAARGDGADSPAGASERTALRFKALTWLQADLALRKKQATSADPAQHRMAAMELSSWLTDQEFAALRPGLPRNEMSADERAQWDAFWADVEAARANASSSNQSVKSNPAAPEKKKP